MWCWALTLDCRRPINPEWSPWKGGGPMYPIKAQTQKEDLGSNLMKALTLKLVLSALSKSPDSLNLVIIEFTFGWIQIYQYPTPHVGFEHHPSGPAQFKRYWYLHMFFLPRYWYLQIFYAKYWCLQLPFQNRSLLVRVAKEIKIRVH